MEYIKLNYDVDSSILRGLDITCFDHYLKTKEFPVSSLGELWAHEAYIASQKRKELERVERELLDKLKVLAAGQTTVWGEFIFVKTMRAGSINYAAIPELMNVRLEEYRKSEVESWTLTKK